MNFDSFDEELVRQHTVAASQAITNARRWQRPRETVAQLEKALVSRSDTDMAKGALMAVHGCDSREAFTTLVDESNAATSNCATSPSSCSPDFPKAP